MSRTELRYFSENYEKSRAAFLSRIELFKCEVKSFRVPSLKDPDLFVDSVSIGSQSAVKKLLVLTSGIHGIEGATGSAIQNMFLRDFADQFQAAGWEMLLVHCLNPFGFKYHRRSTENNINLNRNFLLTKKGFQTENPGYEKLAKFLGPAQKARSPRAALVKNISYVLSNLAIKRFTHREFLEGVAQGQYSHPLGLEFGGTDYEPQSRFLIDQMKAALTDKTQIAFIDLHTGLGDRYEMHFIPGRTTGQSAWAKNLFRHHENKDLYSYTPQESAGFYRTTGDLPSYLPVLIRNDQELVSATLEFGTLGNGTFAKLESLNRLILENQSFHHGAASKAVGEKIQRSFNELFFPAEEEWRINVIIRSRELFRRMLVERGQPLLKR